MRKNVYTHSLFGALADFFCLNIKCIFGIALVPYKIILMRKKKLYKKKKSELKKSLILTQKRNITF